LSDASICSITAAASSSGQRDRGDWCRRFDGRRALDITAPPLLGDHDKSLREGGTPWAPREPR
jgi:hypothetical protein